MAPQALSEREKIKRLMAGENSLNSSFQLE
jgi:hypothetical protein